MTYTPTPEQAAQYSETDRLEAELTAKARADGLLLDGFDPVFNYQNGVTPSLYPNCVKLVVGNHTLTFSFDMMTPANFPTIPLRGYGKVWHEGWDIPTEWAVDGSGNCWMDNAHGGGVVRCSNSELLNLGEGESKARIYKCLGRKPPMPDWIKGALSAGWTPPPSFDRSIYHED